MDDGVARGLFVVIATICFASSANAQMGGGQSAGFGASGNLAEPHSTNVLSFGQSGSTYTPFERLRWEKQSVATRGIAPKEKQQAEPAHVDADETDAREAVFRIRTTRVYPQPNLAIATRTFRPIYVLSDTPRERQIRETLDKPAGKMVFAEMPLCDVVGRIAKERAIAIEIDTKAFEDAGLDVQTPVTRTVPDVSLRAALHLLLDGLDLTYLFKNEALVITTKDKAAETLQIVLYPVPWLSDDDRVIEFVENTVEPTTWNRVGGQGAIRRFEQFLCVSQTEEVHEQVHRLLERIWETEFLPNDSVEAGAKQGVVTRVHQVIDKAVLPDLAARLTGICNTALGSEGDAAAKVFVVGNRIVVQSSSRAFHVYAAEVITAFNGVEVNAVERFEGGSSKQTGIMQSGTGGTEGAMGGGTGGGMF